MFQFEFVIFKLLLTTVNYIFCSYSYNLELTDL